MPAVAAAPLLTPNEAGFTVKSPKLETSKEFQGNGDRALFFLSFLIPTAMSLKDSSHCFPVIPLSLFQKQSLFFLACLYICCFFIVSYGISALFVRKTVQYCIHIQISIGLR